ncbi:uncharacterized protein TNCV_4939021 [Trichonephila clavipes]|nr:uncharacterized protein TNCV_4939021 [Trichonephila clavipes]
MQSVEEFFENSDFPLNTQIFTSDFGDLTSSQLDSPFEDDVAEDKIFSCSDCSKFFKHKNFKRLKKNVHGSDENRCNHCNKNFARSDSLKRHIKSHEVSRAKILENKRKRLNSSPQPGPSGYQAPAAKDRRDNTKSRTCLNTFETYTISTDLNFIKNLNGFLQNSKEEVVRIVENKSKEKKGIKWYVCAKVRFVRKTAETEEEKCESHFRSICEISLLNESPEKKVTEAFLKILSSCEEFEGRGSGWILDEILHLEVKTCAYQPLAPSSYIPLPKTITKKKAVINIKNSDEKCFLWCVLAALHPVNIHAERISNYLSFEKEINSKHVPCGFAYVIVGPDGTMVKPPTVFRGKNAIDQFLTKLLDEEKSILDILRFVKPMVFSMTDEENFKSSTLCSICENPLNGDAVRDHDHLTGAYRGAAHNRCYLNFNLANYIPVVIHNLRNYDGHFLIQGIDIFENFRTLCQNYYKIDPCHTYTAPGLAWQACLKITKVRLELLTDIDMHLFIEKGIRGGVAMISHRYAKANNAYLSNYDSSLPSTVRSRFMR